MRLIVSKSIITCLILFFLFSCSKDDSSLSLKVGDSYKGGIIFYILKSGDPSYIEGETHGFIAGKELPDTYVWGCFNFNSWSSSLGDGEANTALIASTCPGENASSACLALSGGWYLPNETEAKEMIKNKLLIGENTNNTNIYWTCSSRDLDRAVAFSFNSPTNAIRRNIKHKVKPIKRF